MAAFGLYIRFLHRQNFEGVHAVDEDLLFVFEDGKLINVCEAVVVLSAQILLWNLNYYEAVVYVGFYDSSVDGSGEEAFHLNVATDVLLEESDLVCREPAAPVAQDVTLPVWSAFLPLVDFLDGVEDVGEGQSEVANFRNILHQLPQSSVDCSEEK